MSEIDLNSLYYLLLQQMTDGIILTDSEGNIVFVNQSAEEIRNVDKNTILGHHILDCHRTTSRDRVERAISFLQTHRDKSFHRMVTDDKNQRIFENTYSAIFNGQNTMTGMAVISKDITARRRAEAERANISRSQVIAIDNLKAQYYNLQMAAMEMLSNIMESKDKYTNGHSNDAMHSCRPYRNAMPFERCVKEIQENAGTQFDPEWTEVFVNLAETGSIE